MEPPLSPWTNIKSTRGSGGEYSKFRPYGPQESSFTVLVDLFREKERLFSTLKRDEDPSSDSEDFGEDRREEPSDDWLSTRPPGSLVRLLC